ncbi:uncharacterized protein LOC132047917 [Lycium ferocissimum]|uniref:uncharacterized protein LOC132047917 n=1 Tax=Lycium ferocissimum TaxID=112874 RepID=UPI0028166A25|nr:uncharacterized protein LOC132047917 [Lycium ferocissimum]
MDCLTRQIQGEVPWCMLFADDIVLIDETRGGVNAAGGSRQTAESQSGLSWVGPRQYMECKFGDVTNEVGVEVTLGTCAIQKKGSFKYLGSIIPGNGDINGDVSHCIGAKVDEMEARFRVLCDEGARHQNIKARFYKVVVRPTLLYGAECWAVKNSHV